MPHAQLITYRAPQQVQDEILERFTDYFATHEKLLSKVWLDDAGNGAYGGFYVWQDSAAMDEFMKSDVVRDISGMESLTDLASTDWAVAETPSRATRGLR